jgi:hypothetical protein
VPGASKGLAVPLSYRGGTVSGTARREKPSNSKGVDLAAQVTGSKTVTKDASPNATAAVLTALLATPIETLTVSQFRLLADVLRKVPGGDAPGKTIGSLLN